MAWPSFK